MVRKPDIQYVGQFYVYGSEAKKLEKLERREKIKNALPLERLRNIREVRLDPVALFGIAVAVVMMVTMIVGAVQIRSTWDEYEQMQRYVANLEQRHGNLEREYRNGYDLAEIEKAALAMGMISREEAQSRQITVSVPVPPEEPSAWEAFRDYLRWFADGLFA